MFTHIKKIITTFFYLGYLPLIPGTFASIAGLFIYILLREQHLFLILTHAIIIVLGFLLTGNTARLFYRSDPPQIVIDEVNGMLISFLGLSVGDLAVFVNRLILIAGFIIFRFFDVLKPYPANWLERRSGSIGIMGDDIVAGIYTNLVLRLLYIFN